MEREASHDRGLDVVQRWFQAVVTHPEGIGDGIESAEARQLIPMSRDELERVILRSAKLTAHERLNIYANAYYARLQECLGQSFAILKRALGGDVFDAFTYEYLQHYPSRRYTLDALGDNFVRFLSETRPDLDDAGRPPATPNWPDFLIDLATLEHSIEKIFDGPGVEKDVTLSPEALSGIGPDAFATATFVPVPCLCLLRFRYPVNAYYSLARQTPQEQELTPPEPGEEYIALNRRHYVVRRHTLTHAQYVLLDLIMGGKTIGQAIESASRVYPGDDAQLAADLRRWFFDWARQGFFRSVIPVKRPHH